VETLGERGGAEQKRGIRRCLSIVHCGGMGSYDFGKYKARKMTKEEGKKVLADYIPA